jgi:large subunit ribosomal protein L10
MAVTKDKKAEVLKDLNDKFSRAKAVYFSGYRGITVKKMVALRKKLHKEGVDYAVAKKTLYKIAAKNNNYPEIPDDIMEGPVAAAFGYDDVVIPVKVLHEFAKEAEQLVILGGLVDGKLISKAEAKVLAMLPSKEQLLAKLVGSMKAPISGFHGVLAGTIRKLVYALAAVRDKKPAA